MSQHSREEEGREGQRGRNLEPGIVERLLIAPTVLLRFDLQ